MQDRPKAVRVCNQAEDLEFVRGRYRWLAGVDDAVGEVLNVMEREQLLQNTAIVFGSDNGFFHGEHRLRNKRLMYEPSIRIPMIFRYPGLVPDGGRVIDEMEVYRISQGTTWAEKRAGVRIVPFGGGSRRDGKFIRQRGLRIDHHTPPRANG